MLTAGMVLLDRYQIIRQIGAGGMGAVYLAVDLRLGNRQVVVKENEGSDQQQFRREAVILARLSHPNLPRVYDSFEAAGKQYLVMEFVEGQSVDALVQQSGPVQESQALHWIRQVFDAVKYLHANRVIHRDIKPENILITSQGRVVLVDFGIAKILTRGTATSAGAHAIGSPGYAPPEQYSGGTDERSDVYALGATLYFVLTGTIPPEATKRAAGILLEPPRQINKALSPNTETAIQVAMSLSAVQRFRSVTDFERALFQEPKAVPITRPRKTPSSRTIEHTREKSRWELFVRSVAMQLERKVTLMIAILVSLLIVIFGLYSCQGPSSQPLVQLTTPPCANIG